MVVTLSLDYFNNICSYNTQASETKSRIEVFENMVDRSSLDYFQKLGSLDQRIVTQKPGPTIEPLPDSFQPGENDVLCIGGKEGSEHVGNKRYRICIANHVTAYRNANSKYDKSMLVSRIVASVKEGAGNGLGGFVKKDPVTGRWYQVEDKIAREKVSHALRDAIKVQKKKEARQRRNNERQDTRVTPNKPIQLKADVFSSQFGIESMIARPSPCLSTAFPNEPSQGFSKKGLVIAAESDDDCLFNGMLNTVGNCHGDWETSLKECTERFLDSDDSDLYCGLSVN